ncbi:hypothetical protein BCR44DRAFT_1441185 [Catenaria anguillulae PL171]|uniref:Uncharacterized protein n=1 Tax=Catenaria anguillulae PL171 TaxID=765915 RepID=A0A1Y2HDB9_9FUNG|nr:hypothetical protein BCR44DRAFT_1441185 [Catenaria anguillulae PL171]
MMVVARRNVVLIGVLAGTCRGNMMAIQLVGQALEQQVIEGHAPCVQERVCVANHRVIRGGDCGADKVQILNRHARVGNVMECPVKEGVLAQGTHWVVQDRRASVRKVLDGRRVAFVELRFGGCVRKVLGFDSTKQSVCWLRRRT